MDDLRCKIAFLGSAQEARIHLTLKGSAECAKASNPVKMAKSAGKPCLRPWSDTAGSHKGRRRIQPAERGPGGGLTATYCTPLGWAENGHLG